MAVTSITVNGPTGNDIVDTGRGASTDKGVQNKVTPDMINTAFTTGRTTKTDGGKVDEKKINDERGKEKGIPSFTAATTASIEADRYVEITPGVSLDPHLFDDRNDT